MNILRSILYTLPTVFAFAATAQVTPPCPSPLPPGAESCQTACVYCDFYGYIGISNGTPSGGNQICGQIAVHNDQWLGFVAGSETITFDILTSNCTEGNGLQAAIFASCDDLDALICNPGMAGGAGLPLTLTYSGYVPGQTYFLMVDGWTADVCEFEIAITDGLTIPQPPGQPEIPQGPTLVCPGATVEYTVPIVENAGYYQWTAPAGASINGQGNNVTIPASDFGANTVTVAVTFGQAGGSICVGAGNACFPANQSCLNVASQPLPVTMLPGEVFSAYDLPIVWNQPPYHSISAPGFYTLTSSGLDSYLGCDSMVRQTIEVIPISAANAYGIIYYDIDNDGVLDSNSGENFYTTGVVLQTSDGQTVTSNYYGTYAFAGLSPGDTIWATNPTPGAEVNPPFHIFTNGLSFEYNFGIYLPPAPASGTVYIDFNQNGIWNAGEPPFADGALIKTSSGQLTTTLADGTYVADNLLSGDTIRALPPSPGVEVKPPFRIFTNGLTATYDFGLAFPILNYDLAVDLTNFTPFRPGFYTDLKLTARNNLPYFTPPVQAKIVLPGFIGLSGASPQPDIVSGDTIIWNFGVLEPNQKSMVYISVYTEAATLLNTPVSIPAFVLPVADDDAPADNDYTLTATVTGSYDPNDKQVSPAYVTPSMLSDGQPFEYTIRFQNTGNFPAEFVKVIDTLGNTVDPTTFRFISSSHPCTWKVEGQGVVEFFFENIDLPDSLSNEQESHGFVKFSVQPKKDLALGSFVENFCDIYFDFNQPVRTNTAGTQVVYFLPGEGFDITPRRLMIWPNPATSYISCNWKRPAPATGHIRLFDLTGLPRLEVPVEEGVNRVDIDVQALPPGLYFVLVEAGELVLTNKVIIVQQDFWGGN